MQSSSRLLVLFVLFAFGVHTAHAQWSVYQDGDVRAGGRLYVHGERGVVQGYGPGIHVTSDDGATWTGVRPSWSGSSQMAGALAFGDRFYMYANTGTDSFLRTADSMENWEVVPGLVKNSAGESHGVATLLTDGDVLWGRTSGGDHPYGRIFTSTDGENWTHVAEALDYSNYMFYDGQLYAKAGPRMMASDDYGATWEDVATVDLEGIQALVPASDRIYAHVKVADQEQELYVSGDGGATWSLLRTLQTYNIQVRTFDGHKVAIFWVEGGKQQIAVSTNRGQTWQQFEGPIFGTGYVYDGHVYLSTGFSQRSVYRTSFGALGVSAEDAPVLPAAAALQAAYPNPFATVTGITYDLPQRAHVDVRAYDVMGREVAHLLSGTRPAGEGQVTFDASRLPSGVYLVRLTAAGHTATQRVLLTR